MCIFLRIVVGIKKNETEDWFIHLSPLSDNFSADTPTFPSRSRPLCTRFPSFTFYPFFPFSHSSSLRIALLHQLSDKQLRGSALHTEPAPSCSHGHRMTPITHCTLDCSSETATDPSDHCGPLYLKHILTHTRGNRADQRLNGFFSIVSEL